MDIAVRGKVTILCSGFGLGFYIPGILVSETLRSMGIETSVEVFESLLPAEKIHIVERNRQACHHSFRVALTSQKIRLDSHDELDPLAVDALLKGWQQGDCRHFICLSGHWVHVLDRYREMGAVEAIQADLLYVDADLTTSWRWLRRLKPQYAAPYHEVRFYDPMPSYAIGTNVDAPLPYAARGSRLVVHGGGWGIGTYHERVPAIEAKGYGLDIVCYTKSDAVQGFPERRYFMDDPDWRTWHRNEAGEHTFPPFGEIVPSSADVTFTSQTHCHGLHRVIRNAQGIVSKPGAGTLIDSFSAATPLIMLEPFGPHEERNAQVWEASGFGVPYQVWAEAGYPSSMLEKLHLNLLARRESVKDYARDYAKTALLRH